MARHFDSFIALKNITGQFEVTLIPSCSIKFNKRKFDFGMARKDRFFLRSRTKVGKQKTIDKVNPGVHQSAIACGAVIGNGTL